MLPSSWKIVEDNTLSRGSPLDTELMFRSLSLLYHRYVPTNHSKKDDEENLGLVRLNATWGPCNGGLFNCVVVLKLLWPAESFFCVMIDDDNQTQLSERGVTSSFNVWRFVHDSLLRSLSYSLFCFFLKIERWTTCAAPVRYSRLSLTDLLTSVEKRRITPQSDCWRSNSLS